MGASGEHDLLAQGLSFTDVRKFGIPVLQGLEDVAVFRRVELRHEAARVVLGPVVAEDETRLHAVCLELFEKDGVRFGSVDAHAHADDAALDLIFDRGVAFLEHVFEIAQARRLPRFGGDLFGMSFADVGGADPLHVFEDAVDGLLDALRGGARDVMRGLERLEVETVR